MLDGVDNRFAMAEESMKLEGKSIEFVYSEEWKGKKRLKWRREETEQRKRIKGILTENFPNLMKNNLQIDAV